MFYTGTIGAGAVAPTLYGFAGDAFGVPVVALMLVAAIVLLTLPLAKSAVAPGAAAGDDIPVGD